MAKYFALATLATAAQPTFREWKAEFGISYNSDAEDAARAGIYASNVAWIDSENAAEKGYTVAVNQFAAMTLEEFKTTMLTRKAVTDESQMPVLGVHEYAGESLLADVDWSSQGAVTPVKDQGSCGGCWSFAATGALEGATKVAGNSLVSLSEQQFLDCDKTDQGCGGGLEYDGWTFFKGKNEGICTESSYKYKGRNGNCAYSSCTLGIQAGGISGITHVGKSASALQSALNSRPVAIGIEADQSAFQFYSGGILTGSCGKNLDHSVLAVGYGSNYWKVKNSWGASWGDNGYVKISNSGDECGIYDDASYPTVKAGSVQV